MTVNPVGQGNILAGLYSYLTGNSTFNGAIGGDASTAGRLFYGHVPELDPATDADWVSPLPFPYAVYLLVAGEQYNAMDKDGYDYRVQVSCYASQGSTAGVGGPEDVVDVADKLRARLQDARPTTTGHNLYGIEEAAVRGPFFDMDAWRVDIDFFVKGYKS